MVDQEVVDVLAAIKERIIAAQRADAQDLQAANAEQIATPIPIENRFAGLTVLARAWDRLPPLVSNRSGVAARFELWLKGNLRRAFRWFTWEQVNFNAATHRTLLEVIQSLSAVEQQTHELRQEINARREEFNRQRAELISEIKTHREQVEHYQASLKTKERELNAQRAIQSELQSKVNALEEIVEGFRQLDEQVLKRALENDREILEETRVCFKQLSLELSESRTLNDRLRRELQAQMKEKG